MRVIIISAAFYPLKSPRSFRTTELVKELVRKGHGVTVLTVITTNDIAIFTKKYPCNIINIGPKASSIFDSSSGWLIIRRAKKLLNRGVQWLLDYPDSMFMHKVHMKLRGLKDFDLMISIAAPHAIHWGVALRRSSNNPIARTWVADCGDPYMGLELEAIRKPIYFTWIEKWMFRKTDYITVPIEGSKKAYFKEFESKIKIIPQGFDLKIANQLPIYRKNKTTSFAYAGGLSAKGVRCPFRLLELLTKVKTNFIFYIFSPDIVLLTSYKKVLDQKLVLNKAVERHDLLKELTKMDFLINFDNRVTTQMPSKLIDYALVNRPVLSLKASSPVLTDIEEFIAENYSKAMRLPSIQEFDITVVTEKFLSLSK